MTSSSDRARYRSIQPCAMRSSWPSNESRRFIRRNCRSHIGGKVSSIASGRCGGSGSTFPADGADSAVICISIACSLDVRATLNFQVSSVDDAIALADRIAPEHVSIHARGAAGLAERLENCGAIFCGPFSPVAAGDYVAGPNHVLPTGGSARFFSPLGVYDFVKRSNVITLTEDELSGIADAG